jgi:hypothetical protein
LLSNVEEGGGDVEAYGGLIEIIFEMHRGAIQGVGGCGDCIKEIWEDKIYLPLPLLAGSTIQKGEFWSVIALLSTLIMPKPGICLEQLFILRLLDDVYQWMVCTR